MDEKTGWRSGEDTEAAEAGLEAKSSSPSSSRHPDSRRAHACGTAGGTATGARKEERRKEEDDDLRWTGDAFGVGLAGR